MFGMSAENIADFKMVTYCIFVKMWWVHVAWMGTLFFTWLVERKDVKRG
jgi:hypothetical protein